MNPIAAALLASATTYVATAIGAATVFVVPHLTPRFMATLLVIAVALMGWASITGLLMPAITKAALVMPLLLAVVGVMAAAALGAWGVRALRARLALVTDHGPVLGRQLFLIMTLHHVPEGMAVGLAVAAAQGGDPMALAGAGSLVLAMAIHNAAEGALVSLPLRAEGLSRGRAWMRGQWSGLAEIGGALIGATAAVVSAAILPWALALAGGAMAAVVVGDLLPELRAVWRQRSHQRETLAKLS